MTSICRAKWKADLPFSTGLIPGAIAVLTLSIYLTDHPKHETGDTVPTRLIPILLLTQGDLYFDDYLPTFQKRFSKLKEHLYFVRKAGLHYVSFYPIAPGVVLTPFYAPFVLHANASHPDPDHWLYFASRSERIAAAIVATLSVLALYAILLHLGATFTVSVALSIAYAFGTNIFTLSEHLWQHGFTALFSQLAILSGLIKLPERGRRYFTITGLLLGLAVACRPTSLAFVTLIIVWFAIKRRDIIIPLLIGMAVVLLPVAIYNYDTYGNLAGGYKAYASVHNLFDGYRGFFLSGPSVLRSVTILMGLLISPGRGLFFYFPLGMLAIWGLYVAVKQRDKWASFYKFVGLAAAAHICLIWIVTRNNIWWGGHCWGPRFLSEIEFALIILLLPLLQYGRGILKPALATVLGIVSIFMQTVGVYATSNWNVSPVDVDQMPERNWSLADNPVSRALLVRKASNRNNVGYEMFQSQPASVKAAKPPRRVHLPEGNALLVVAPSQIEFDIPSGATEVVARFGFVPRAYQNGGRTKGAEFSVVWTNGQERVEIYRRFLDPVNVEADRGLQDLHEELRGIRGGRLLFQTNPGPGKHAYWAWTVWTDIAISGAPVTPKND